MVGERFNVSEQISHLADIETAYHHRFHRLLTEDCPELVSLDGERLASERSYATANCEEVLEAFSTMRAENKDMLTRLSETELARRGYLHDFGEVTIDGLAHHLCAHDHLHLAGIQWLRGQMKAHIATFELPSSSAGALAMFPRRIAVRSHRFDGGAADDGRNDQPETGVQRS